MASWSLHLTSTLPLPHIPYGIHMEYVLHINQAFITMDFIWIPCGIHMESLEQKLMQRQGLDPPPLDQQSHDMTQLTTEPNRYIYLIELVVFITLLDKFLIIIKSWEKDLFIVKYIVIKTNGF